MEQSAKPSLEVGEEPETTRFADITSWKESWCSECLKAQFQVNRQLIAVGRNCLMNNSWPDEAPARGAVLRHCLKPVYCLVALSGETATAQSTHLCSFRTKCLLQTSRHPWWEHWLRVQTESFFFSEVKRLLYLVYIWEVGSLGLLSAIEANEH